jgi:hypothetical protein
MYQNISINYFKLIIEEIILYQFQNFLKKVNIGKFLFLILTNLFFRILKVKLVNMLIL